MCGARDAGTTRRRTRRWATWLIAGAAFMVGAPTASAASGTIAYTHTPGYQVPFTFLPWDTTEGPRIDATEASGGTPHHLIKAPASTPSWSPTGDRLAFAGTVSAPDGQQIVVARPDGRQRRAVTRASENRSDDQPSWSPDGRQLVFRRDGWGLYRVTAAGGHAHRLTSSSLDREPAWGSNGQIAFVRFRARHWHIFVMAENGTRVRRLSSGPTNDRAPTWSPDGTEIAFAREHRHRIDLFTIRPDGTGLRQLTHVRADEADRTPAWSPDGTALAYSAWGPYGNDHEIMLLNLADGTVQRLTDNRGDDLDPTWRPTGVATAARRKRSPLRGRRHRLPGLASWIGMPQEGDGSECMAYPAFLPRGPVLTFHTHQSGGEVLHGGRQEVGTRGFICAYGFSRSRKLPFRVSLRHPDGTVERLHPQSAYGASAIVYWVARRRTEGNYRVVLTKGRERAHMTFRVTAPDSPHLVILDPRERSEVPVRLGRSVPILITGLRPRARAWLDLYRFARRWRPPPAGCKGCQGSWDWGHKFFNSVRIRARNDGTLLYRLPTNRDVQPTGYLAMLRLGRRQYSGAEFTLRRR